MCQLSKTHFDMTFTKSPLYLCVSVYFRVSSGWEHAVANVKCGWRYPVNSRSRLLQLTHLMSFISSFPQWFKDHIKNNKCTVLTGGYRLTCTAQRPLHKFKFMDLQLNSLAVEKYRAFNFHSWFFLGAPAGHKAVRRQRAESSRFLLSACWVRLGTQKF